MVGGWQLRFCVSVSYVCANASLVALRVGNTRSVPLQGDKPCRHAACGLTRRCANTAYVADWIIYRCQGLCMCGERTQAVH